MEEADGDVRGVDEIITRSVSGIGCEMLCKNPFIRVPVGVNAKTVLLSNGREMGTPFPCGQCLFCRINKSREWTHRILLESMMHAKCCFVTLTYNDECLPSDGLVSKSELQKFFKRLRYYGNCNIRYYGVGEYGSDSLRPHYHAIVYGLGVEDVELIGKAWRFGFVSVGDVTKDSARYVTKYVIKGMAKKDVEIHKKEFMISSRKGGGIGAPALDMIASRLKGVNVNRVVRELFYGKRALPLGRYLTEKLRVKMGVSDMVKDMEYYDYQVSVVDKNVSDGLYIDTLMSSTEKRRYRNERRNKFFKKGDSL